MYGGEIQKQAPYPLGFALFIQLNDRPCGLVVRVSGYRYRGLGFDSRRWNLERGALSLVSLVRSIEKLLE
jgi:hypothetical protein